MRLFRRRMAVRELLSGNHVLDATSVGVAPAWTVPGFDDSTWPTSAAGPGVGFDFGDNSVINNVPNGTVLVSGLVGSDLTDADQNGTLEAQSSAAAHPIGPAAKSRRGRWTTRPPQNGWRSRRPAARTGSVSPAGSNTAARNNLSNGFARRRCRVRRSAIGVAWRPVNRPKSVDSRPKSCENSPPSFL